MYSSAATHSAAVYQALSVRDPFPRFLGLPLPVTPTMVGLHGALVAAESW